MERNHQPFAREYDVSKKKTVLRTLRISKRMDNILEEEADKKNVSVNTLLNLIITRYIEWGRFVEKLGYVSLAPQQLRGLLEIIDENKIDELSKIQSKYLKGMVTYWFGEANPQTYLEWFSVFGKYCGYFHHACVSDGRNFTLTHEHDFGTKWSIYGKNLIEGGFNDIGIITKSETSGNTVTVKFRISDKGQ